MALDLSDKTRMSGAARIVPGAAPSEEIGLDLTLPHRLCTVSPIRVTISLSIAAGVAKFSRANPA
jgi:hypothetical protein